MSPIKIALLVGYIIIAGIGVVYSGTAAATWAWSFLALLAVAHLVEMAVFYSRCRQAGGSMAGHMLNVFLFGVFHMRELKEIP
ncbi:hypothetical protein F0M18_00245 [Pseudohalioglobus sediminis]|uniref:DUF1145 domain-containing protein n=1 Tax=Pseudohalioglobus sediminis TaxID=2606449 RepID=A0A5B0X3Q5_9GAMM|nr:hypothetical protein [Pseudohalioglobus sediminis]KAA1193913.1 hypothetical protein F0M18_00245 [Pseudohalioglobus sediminis]